MTVEKTDVAFKSTYTEEGIVVCIPKAFTSYTDGGGGGKGVPNGPDSGSFAHYKINEYEQI